MILERKSFESYVGVVAGPDSRLKVGHELGLSQAAISMAVFLLLTGSLLAQSVPVSLFPTSGIGGDAPFTATYSNPAGFANIGGALLAVYNASKSCQVMYYVPTGGFYLTDSAVTYWQGPLGSGSGAYLENDQCVLLRSGSSAMGSGTTLTVNFALGFKPPLLGPNTTAMWVDNTSGVGSGWYTEGSWSFAYPPTPPTSLAVQPSTGIGMSRSFTFSGQSYDGATYISLVQMLFNSHIDGANACYIQYDRSGNAIYLINNDQTQWLGGYAPGTPGAVIQNSACKIDVAHTTVTTVFDTITIIPQLTFFVGPPAPTGIMNDYLYMWDNGNQGSGWQTLGMWSPGTSPLMITTASPLPSAMVGTPYTPQALSATGGTPPYSWSLISGLPPGMSFIAGVLSGTPNAIIPVTLTVQVTDSTSQTANKSFSLTINPPSLLPVSASPSSVTAGPGVGANYMIMVNGSAGFSGAATFTASGLPTGATAVFSPSTINGSGSTNLTITPAANSPNGMFSITITANSGSRSFSTMVFLTVARTSPASMLSPASGSILTGSTATFTWDSGSGASQYQLALGSSPGASDYYIANTGTAQSAMANLPGGNPPKTVYATLTSLISGTWQSRSYIYRVNSASATGPSTVQASGQTPQSFFVFNDNNPQTWPYIINNNANAGYIDTNSFTVSGSGVSAKFAGTPSAGDPTNISSFDVTFTATYTAAPGARNMNFRWVAPDGFTVPLQVTDAVDVFDTTPTINFVQKYEPDAPGGPFYITLYGTNFGPTPGSVAVCAVGATVCNGTSDFSVTVSAAGTPSCPYCVWRDTKVGDAQVNLLLTPSPTAAGLYDVQLTSSGASGNGFQPLPQRTNSKSNRGQFQLTPTPSSAPRLKGSVASPPVQDDGDAVIAGHQFTLQVEAIDPTSNQRATNFSGQVGITLSAGPPGDSVMPGSVISLSQGVGTATINITGVVGTQSKRTYTLAETSGRASPFTGSLFIWFSVTATLEGLVGQRTACNHIIQPSDHFVALPQPGMCGIGVRVRNGAALETTTILDVGPWYPHASATTGNPCVGPSNPYWNDGTTIPRAENDGCSNGAGIDLGDGTGQSLNITGLGGVLWRFN